MDNSFHYEKKTKSLKAPLKPSVAPMLIYVEYFREI